MIMKKVLISIAIVAVAATMAACGNKPTKSSNNDKGKKTQTENTDVVIADSTDAKVKKDIIGLINKLYAVAAHNYEGIDKRFACHVWRETVKAVNEKDSQLEEIGFFNDDYWTMMQDSNPKDL